MKQWKGVCNTDTPEAWDHAWGLHINVWQKQISCKIKHNKLYLFLIPIKMPILLAWKYILQVGLFKASQLQNPREWARGYLPIPTRWGLFWAGEGHLTSGSLHWTKDNWSCHPNPPLRDTADDYFRKRKKLCQFIWLSRDLWHGRNMLLLSYKVLVQEYPQL